jgi:hypothetical protein
MYRKKDTIGMTRRRKSIKYRNTMAYRKQTKTNNSPQHTTQDIGLQITARVAKTTNDNMEEYVSLIT